MNEFPPNDKSQSDGLDQLIASYLESVDRGIPVNRDQFISEHPDHAEGLRRYFENVAVIEQLAQPDSSRMPETFYFDSGENIPADQQTVQQQTVLRGGVDSETSITRQAGAASSSVLHIQEQFGRYQIEMCLGQGAMGAVYLAHDLQLDRRVALKIPKFTDDPNGELLQRFYREARSAATLRSPNICPVFDVGEIAGQHYITMAFIEGRSLKDFTKSKKHHVEKQIAVTVRKLAEALGEAHDIGVVHRDLKPANIMIDRKGEPVVMDFGLARRSNDDVQVTQSGAILGTPAYMSPEQIAGDQSQIGPQCDIYALGVILYELLTGELPFQGNMMSLLQQIALNNPRPPSELREDVDPQLESICLKMMAGDVSVRYGSMKEVADDLHEFLKKLVARPNSVRRKSSPATQKPGSIPSISKEPNPALISIQPAPSITEQLRQKKGGAPEYAKWKQNPESHSGPPPRSQRWLIAGGVLGGALLLGIVFLVRVGKYDVQITLDDPAIQLSVDGEVLKIRDGKKSIRLSAGKHQLQLEKGGLKTHVEEFTVEKHGKTALRAMVVNGTLDALKNGEKPVKIPAEKPLPKRLSHPENLSIGNTNRSSSLNQAVASEHAQKFKDHSSSAALTSLYFDQQTDEVLIPSLTDQSDSLTIEVRLQRDASQILPHSQIVTFDRETGIKTTPISTLGFADGGHHLESDWDRFKGAGVGKPISLAGVRDAQKQQFRLYFDGALIAKSHLTTSKGGSFLKICGDSRQYIGYRVPRNLDFTGWINELRISNNARYDGPFTPQSRLEADANTLALYHFEEGQGDVLHDSSGNGHDGKIVGAKWTTIGKKPTTNHSSTSHLLPQNENVDIVPLIDPGRDVDGDPIVIDSNGITVGYKSTLLLPVKLEGDYEIQARFTTLRSPKLFHLLCPVNSRIAQIALAENDNEDGYLGAGLLSVDGHNIRDPANTTVTHKKFLVPGQKQTCLCRVTSHDGNVSIQTSVDGKMLLDWTGAATSLTGQTTASENRLKIFIYKGAVQLHSLKLKVLSGKAELIRVANN